MPSAGSGAGVRSDRGGLLVRVSITQPKRAMTRLRRRRLPRRRCADADGYGGADPRRRPCRWPSPAREAGAPQQGEGPSASAVTAAIARASEGGPREAIRPGEPAEVVEECQGRYCTSVHGPDEAYIEGGCTSTRSSSTGATDRGQRGVRHGVQGFARLLLDAEGLPGYGVDGKGKTRTCWFAGSATASGSTETMGSCAANCGRGSVSDDVIGLVGPGSAPALRSVRGMGCSTGRRGPSASGQMPDRGLRDRSAGGDALSHHV